LIFSFLILAIEFVGKSFLHALFNGPIAHDDEEFPNEMLSLFISLFSLALKGESSR
jgi:hypothetical protein